jgi:DNA-binding GntR family transcriptional regulator
MAQLLDCAPGQPWVRLQAMRLLSGTQLPVSWLEAYVLPRFADVIDHPNPDGAPLLKQVEAAHGHRAAQAQVEIRTGRISAEQAGPLHAEEGAPALLILRRYRGSDGQVYLMTRSSHPENRFSLNFMFQKQ